MAKEPGYGPMDEAMDEHGGNARLPQDEDVARSDERPGGSSESPASCGASWDAHRATDAASTSSLLTHRPRGLAHLNAHLNGDLNPAAIRAAGGNPAVSRPDPACASGRSPSPAQDLRPFADQLVAIAEQLRSAAPGAPAHHPSALQSPLNRGPVLASSNAEREAGADREPPAGRLAGPGSAPESGAQAGVAARQRYAELARLAYARRRKRTTIFDDPELFGEPAWDILLDLYIAQAESKPVSVSSACIGSAAPPTTGLRWLGVLADHGLVEREHDRFDQRRVLVRLTPKALEAMDEYFASSLALTADRRSARG